MDSGKIRLLLVNTNIEKAPYPVPPVGLCMIASALEQDYEVKVYDGVFDEGKSLPGIVSDFQPRFIGFSIRNIDDVVADRSIFYIEGIIRDFIDPVRKITRVPVILGGSGFNMFPEEIMKMTGADYGVTGDGEDGLKILLKKLIDNEEVPRIIHGRMNGNQVPFPDIDRFINFEPYRNRGVYSIQTKRGCVHGCIYCSYPVIEGKQFRVRNATDIVDEIEQAADRLGDITFEFVDSTFNDPEGHAENICREIIRRGKKFRMRTMGINPRHCSETLFLLMKQAGFIQIDATPDTASPRMLKSMGKGFSMEDIRKMARLIRSTDMPTMWFFLFGGPGENEETFSETMDFIDEYVNPADLVYLNYGLRIYPGTPLHGISIREGKIPPGIPMLYPPFFYFPEEPLKSKIGEMIRQASAARHNCIPSSETKPSPEMMKEAMMIREKEGLNEVMFRTLMRVRKKWKEEGKL